MKRIALILVVGLASVLPSIAQEDMRLRPDARQRPAPTERPAGKGGGEAHDPSIDDAKATEQQDLVTKCRPAGAATPGSGPLPSQAKTAEADEKGNCLPAPSGQPLGNKAADKLSDPKESPTKPSK